MSASSQGPRASGRTEARRYEQKCPAVRQKRKSLPRAVRPYSITIGSTLRRSSFHEREDGRPTTPRTAVSPKRENSGERSFLRPRYTTSNDLDPFPFAVVTRKRNCTHSRLSHFSFISKLRLLVSDERRKKDVFAREKGHEVDVSKKILA